MLQKYLGVTSKKNNSIFTDIIQIEVDPPPSHPIFDKLFFDNVFIMLTSLPPNEFLTKIIHFQALKLHHVLSILTFTYYIVNITLKEAKRDVLY